MFLKIKLFSYAKLNSLRQNCSFIKKYIRHKITFEGLYAMKLK